jgi:hypothetical protein
MGEKILALTPSRCRFFGRYHDDAIGGVFIVG